MSLSKGLVFGLAVAAFACASLVHGQQAAGNLVRLTGAQLQDILDKETPWAGVNHFNGCAFMVTGPANDRTQYLSCPDGTGGTYKGSQVVEGDVMCISWSYAPKRCTQWYQAGENKFHQRESATAANRNTIYLLK